MKSRLLLLLAPGLLAILPARAAAPIEAKVFAHTNARIEALFRLRDEPPVFINTRNNPFRSSGEFPIESPVSGDSNPVPEIASDESLLAQAVATLKVTGVMEAGGRTRLTINRSNYAEGDILQVRLGQATVDLRVMSIATKSVIFRLNATDLELKF